MWDLVGNPEDPFSQNEAQIMPNKDSSTKMGLRNLSIENEANVTSHDALIPLGSKIIGYHQFSTSYEYDSQ